MHGADLVRRAAPRDPDHGLPRPSFALGDAAGEQFDVVIHDHQHVLVEIAANVGRTIQTRLERKRRLYEESTGVRPARVILATASIHSALAHQLRHAGIQVIEPEEPDDPPE